MKAIHTEIGVNAPVRVAHYGYVLASYVAAYADPITMKAGELLVLDGREDNWQGWTWLWCSNQQGKSGWVPQSYVKQTEQEGYVALYDYNAKELSVQIGEALLVAQFESGWFWCSDQHGQSGWVPAEHVLVLSNMVMDAG